MERSRTFTGVGYDSGLAYGTGMQVARSQGVEGQPKGIEMGCFGYFLKPFLAGAVVAAAAADSKTDQSLRLGAAGLALAVMVLAPNCVATLHFADPEPVPTSPTPPAPAPPRTPVDGPFTDTVR
jgi:hypothetical protein